MKLDVLFIGNFLSASGGSRGVCEELAQRLSANGAKVLTTSRRRNRMLRLLDMVGTAVFQSRNYSVAQVDVFSGAAFLWAEITCATLRLLRKPFVLTLHGGNLPEFARNQPDRVRRLLNAAKIVTAPSRYLQEKLSPYRNDIRLLVNALETERCVFRLRNRVEPSLIWIRSFHEIYNPALAPQVLKWLVGRFPEARLTMVGPDKKDGSWQHTARTAMKLHVMDRMCFRGGVAKTEVPKWMNRGDIFLNTTNVDNTPVSVLEAMACGLCVVSTNVGGLPYLLKNESDALLVPPRRPRKMAEAVQRILHNPNLAERLSQNASAKAMEHDWSNVLPQWEQLLGDCARPDFAHAADARKSAPELEKPRRALRTVTITHANHK